MAAMESSNVPVRPLYVFDLDGVITNPQNSQVNQEVLRHILRLLRSGAPVAVNTGRSYAWVEQNLNRYVCKQSDATLLQNYIVVCEMGGETVTWQDGVPRLRSNRFALSPEVQVRTQAIFAAHSAELDSMLWDDTKRTMATIEKRPTADLATFHHQQNILAEYLRSELSGANVYVGTTTVAVDVQSPQAGKHAGAELILEWANGLKPTANYSFISIGDSLSDYDMAHYFAEQGMASTFVYVGRTPQALPAHNKVRIITPTKSYAEGALEFLTLQ